MLNKFSEPCNVAILMCTYNGEAYLDDQLQSIEQQTFQNWKLYVSDDGSQDRTIEILRNYQLKWGRERLMIINGPHNGFSSNFISLTCNLKINASYYAYSDQDDIWNVNKLERAVNLLQEKECQHPLLYCSRTQLINNQKITLGLSPLFIKKPSFRNALVQSLAGGNTMAFNNTLRKLVIEASNDVKVVYHDWWLYLITTACGGEVYYDNQPSLLYRQHDKNIVGSNYGMIARFKRLKLLFEGQNREWHSTNLYELLRLKLNLTADNLKIIDQFQHSRHSWALKRIFIFMKIGLYRQTLMGNIGLYFAIICNKI